MRECQSSFTPPLKQADFLKVKIQIEVYINGMGRKTQSCKSFGIANVVITILFIFIIKLLSRLTYLMHDFDSYTAEVQTTKERIVFLHILFFMERSSFKKKLNSRSFAHFNKCYI